MLAHASTGGAARPAEGGGLGPEAQPKRSAIRVAAVVMIVLLAVFAVFAVAPSVSQIYSGGPTTYCPRNLGSSTLVAAPSPNYDVQTVMVFTQTYAQLEFNVTAVAQCDANGYGPSYLLNGLSNTGYWYQVGINWDWPLQAGGYNPGFRFVTEAWAPGGLTRAPPSVPFSGIVNQGDTVELSMSFSGGRVVTSARDLNTGASGSTSYPANRATTFVGSQAQQSKSRFSFATQGYFTGLMTEWYHVSSGDNGPQQEVTYSVENMSIGSATLGVGEWNFTTPSPTSVFADIANDGNPVYFGSQPNQLQDFTLDGFQLSADGYEFVTGS